MTPLSYENSIAHRFLLQQENVSHCKMSDLQQSFREVQAAGPPVKPLDFPTPVIHPAVFVPMQTVINHDHFTRCGSTEALHHREVQLLCRAGSSLSASHNAYWIKKQISRTAYGTIQLGTVVRRRCSSSLNHLYSNKEEVAAEWMTTGETVAIKISSNVRNIGEFMCIDGPLKGTLEMQLDFCE
jgi:hypothetical protein